MHSFCWINLENVEFVAPEVLDEAALLNLSIVSSCAEATDEVQIEANSTLPTTSDTTIGTDDVISGQPTFDAIMPSFQPSQTLQPIDLPPPFRCCPCCSTPYSSGRNCPVQEFRGQPLSAAATTKRMLETRAL